MSTDLENVNAPVSDETWNAFVRAHEAHIDALEALNNDPEAQASLFAPIPGDLEPEGDASAPKKHADLEHLLHKLETTAPLTPAQAEVIATEGKQLHDAVHQVDTDLHGAVSSLKGKSQPPGDAEWDKYCDDQCAATIKKVTEPIKAAFSKMKKLGHDHPATRGALMTIMSALRTFAETIVNFLNRVLDWVKNALETIWHAIKSAAEWAWDKVKRAGNAIKSFFAHLF
jgi:hypothetical protein